MFRLVQIFIVVASLALAPNALGAGQGALGQGGSATSSGSLRVGLEVTELIKLSGVNNLALDWDAGGQRFTASDGLCVYRNVSGNYSVSASSEHGGSGAFRMSGEEGSSVPYEVLWADAPLSPGQRSPVRSDAHRTSVACDGDDNITLSVRVSSAQVSEASATGEHTDTLTLEIIAE